MKFKFEYQFNLKLADIVLLQLGHTCVVLMRRAIWSIDPTVFEPQYDLQVRIAEYLSNQPTKLKAILFLGSPGLDPHWAQTARSSDRRVSHKPARCSSRRKCL